MATKTARNIFQVSCKSGLWIARSCIVHTSATLGNFLLKEGLINYFSFILDYCTIFDFEGDLSLMHWSKTGSAFDNQPTFLDNLRVRSGRASNHEGDRWIGTRENRKGLRDDIPGDTQGYQPTGTLTSPNFIISGSKLHFLFAGTANQAKSRAELLVDGLVKRTAFSSTGNESLVQMNWDVPELLGYESQIRLVDSGSDAFVSFDGLKSNCHLREGIRSNSDNMTP